MVAQWFVRILERSVDSPLRFSGISHSEAGVGSLCQLLSKITQRVSVKLMQRKKRRVLQPEKHTSWVFVRRR